MLAPGGVALAFVPTLYAPAFALNHAIPESVSSAIVRRLFPDRHEEGDNPKFPAFYDLCLGDEKKVAPVLRAEFDRRRPAHVPSDPPTHASLVAAGPDSPHRQVISSPVAAAEMADAR